MSVFALLVAISLSARVATADPVSQFIDLADSLAKNEDEPALRRAIAENAELVGALVGQLLDAAFLIEADAPADARDNLTLAKRVARIHAEVDGSRIPASLVERYESWSETERAAKARAAGLEEQSTAARGEGELDRAVAYLEEAQTIYQEIGDTRAAAINWGSQGVAHWHRGDWDAVQSSYEKALAGRRTIEDRILEGRTLNGLGSVRYNLGEDDAALVWYEQAVAMRRRTGDLGGLGTSLTYAGNCHLRQGRLVEARGRFEEAMPVLELLGDPGKLLDMNNSVANLNYEMGRYERATRHYRAAVALSREIGQRDFELIIRVNLAATLRQQGAIQSALDELEHVALGLQDMPDPALQAQLHRERGLCYVVLGELARARDETVAFVSAARALDDPILLIEAMVNLGMLYMDLGAYERGLQMTAEARRLAIDNETPRNRRDVELLSGELLRRMGRSDEALDRLQWARARDHEDGIPAALAESEISLANCHAYLNDFESARAGYRRGAVLLEELGKRDDAWLPLLGIAHTYENSHPDSAAIYYDRALGRIEAGRASLAAEAVRTGYLSLSRGFAYEEVIRYYALQHAKTAHDAWSARAFATAERAKAQGLLQLLDRSFAAADDPDAQRILDELYQLGELTADNRERRLSLENEFDQRRARHRATALGAETGGASPPSLKTIQDRMPQGTMLLEFAVGDSASFVWSVRPDGHSLHPLPARAALRQEIAQLRDAVGQPGRADDRLRAVARRLHETLLAPISAEIRSAVKLIVIPDDALSELPFELLLSEDASPEAEWSELAFLGRDHAVSYAPSSSIWLKLSERPTDGAPTGAKLLAVGDADFSGLAPRGQQARLAALPHSREEIEAIAKLNDRDSMVLLGSEATEYRLKQELRGSSPRVLHLATHGLVDRNEPSLSAIALGVDPRSSDDGYLFTLEILALPLNSELVVLSACESGRGRVERGEGVVGLTRAFLAAGARGVVASLWPVSDASTSVLMARFYEELLGGERTTAEALQAARGAMLQSDDYDHPFFWSPFVLVGAEFVLN